MWLGDVCVLKIEVSNGDGDGFNCSSLEVFFVVLCLCDGDGRSELLNVVLVM